MSRHFPFALTLAAVAIGATALIGAAAPRQAPGAEDRVAAIKQALKRDRAAIAKYEWLETTSVSLKGEEKSRKQQRCYYGADGKLQKVPLPSAAAAPAPPAAASGGRRGARVKAKVVENKKEEIQEYMEAAVALVHQYVPPKPEDIDRAKQAGKVAVKPGEGGLARVAFADYLKPGDTFAIDIDPAANKLAGIKVTSYLDKKDDIVNFGVRFGSLADGTGYAEETTLDAPAKNIRVVIQNSGHRPLQP
jgi:hypothetical protein